MTDDDEIRVLLVDDEVRILEGLERQLSLDFDITTANSGFEALRILRDDGPFDVIVSDMRMPRMTGAVFFSRARELWPETSRVLLTGYADASDAADAINRGSIFRYLNKPCDAERLVETINAAAAQTKAQKAQRSVIEETLQSMVRMLSELVSFLDPQSFEGAVRVGVLARQLAKQLDFNDSWQLEIAASMYPLGRVLDTASGRLPTPANGDTAVDGALFSASNLISAAGLVKAVPRLEGVGRILAAIPDDAPLPSDGVEELSTEILRCCILLQRREHELGALDLAASSVQSKAPPRLVEAVERMVAAEQGCESQTLAASELEEGMVLDQEVRMDGKMLAARGQQLTPLMCRRLAELAYRNMIPQKLNVVFRRKASGLEQARPHANAS